MNHLDVLNRQIIIQESQGRRQMLFGTGRIGNLLSSEDLEGSATLVGVRAEDLDGQWGLGLLGTTTGAAVLFVISIKY